MLSTRVSIYTHFVYDSVSPISILLLIIPRYFFIVVAPARCCPGSFFIKTRVNILVLIHSWRAAVRYVLNMSPVKGISSAIRFILSCPILCPDIYLYIHGTAAVCLSCCLVYLSKGVYKHSSVRRIATGSLYIN